MLRARATVTAAMFPTYLDMTRTDPNPIALEFQANPNLAGTQYVQSPSPEAYLGSQALRSPIVAAGAGLAGLAGRPRDGEKTG